MSGLPNILDGRLKNRELLSEGRLARALAALDGDGEETRLIGGAVRDLSLGRPPGDFDLATTALPEIVMKRARAAGFGVALTGAAVGNQQLVAIGLLAATLQMVTHTEGMLRELGRVGRESIVSFPNFAHWPNRLHVAAGRMPVTRVLPYQWYDTPNIRVGTYADFEVLAKKDGLAIIDAFGIQAGKAVRTWPNLLASVAVFKFQRA